MIYHGDSTTDLTKEELLREARILAFRLHMVEFYHERFLIDEMEAEEAIEFAQGFIDMDESDIDEQLED